jgi:hypothetical protein
MSGEGRGLERREAIRRLVGAGLVSAGVAELSEAFFAASRLHAAQSSKAAPRARFFTEAEYEMLARLVSLIIPSDETPGAREARVEEWIDFLVRESDEAVQRLYRDGLARLAASWRERHGSDFRRLPEPLQEEALRETGVADAAFYRALRDDTIFGFYTSAIGLRELRWGGQSAHAECPGCTHPEHLGWKPAPGS